MLEQSSDWTVDEGAMGPLEESAERAKEAVREQPLAYLLAAGLVGFFVGWIVRRLR